MGRVFSFEQLADREVPSGADFEAARSAFAESVTQAQDDGFVRGAMIFGSAAIKKTSPRSDLDCFIVLSDDRELTWDAVMDITTDVRSVSRNRIPLGVIARSATHLQAGRHEMDRFFGAHLTGPHRLVTGEDPAQFLQFSDRPGIQILEDFMVAKARKLSEYAWLDDDRQPELILEAYQRVLELPNAVGRKALRAVDEIEKSSRGIENSADKSLVGNASLALFEELGTSDHAARLLELDARYNSVVTDVLAGNMSAREYRRAIGEFGEAVIPSIGWLIETYEALEARIGR